MRKLAIFLLTFMALTSVTLAQEVTTSPTGAQIGTVTAGTAPDSPLYFLDTAIDNIRYLLTFDSTAKAKVGLEIARERLLEVREMVIENKVNAAQKAQNEHVKTLEKVKTSVTALSRDNSTQELTEALEIEKKLEEHEEEVETVSEELKIKIEVKGGVTAEQQAFIDSVLNLMQNKTGEVKIKIENKKDETKIKIKVETGKSDEEIEDDVDELEKRTGLSDVKQAKAQEQIDDALEEIAEVQALLLQANETQVNGTAAKILVSQAEEHLSRAQAAFNETKLGEAFGLATSAERLAKNAEEILERVLEAEEEEEREIEVEVEKGIAKVKVEIGDLKLRYKLNTANRDEIVNDIAGKTGLSVEEINSILEFELEEEEEEETELEAEIEKGVAKIKTKVRGSETKFVLPTGNRSGIVSEIAKRTGLNQTEVEKILKIGIEEEEKQESEKKEESKESKSGKSEEKSGSKEESKSSSSGSSSSGTSGSSGSGESGKSGKSKED